MTICLHLSCGYSNIRRSSRKKVAIRSWLSISANDRAIDSVDTQALEKEHCGVRDPQEYRFTPMKVWQRRTRPEFGQLPRRSRATLPRGFPALEEV